MSVFEDAAAPMNAAFASAFGVSITWNGAAATTLSGVDGPAIGDSENDYAETRQRASISFDLEQATATDNPLGKIAVYDGVSYVCREASARDEGLVVRVRCEKVEVTEAGSRPARA